MGRMGLSPKLAIPAFLSGMLRPFCLAAMLLIHWRLATGPFHFRLENLIDTAMSDEWQWIVFTFSRNPN